MKKCSSTDEVGKLESINTVFIPVEFEKVLFFGFYQFADDINWKCSIHFHISTKIIFLHIYTKNMFTSHPHQVAYTSVQIFDGEEKVQSRWGKFD